ncbi:MAG: porin [Thermoanaerobaculia bacterium]|jgi:predicted porin
MKLRSTIVIAALLATIAATTAVAEPQPAADQATLQQILDELRQLRADRDAQKQEIDALRAAVDALSRELAAAKQGAAPLPAQPAPPAAAATAPEETPVAEQIATMDPYGSLRVVVGSDTDGNTAMRDNISRVGIKGSARLREGLDVVATAEVGLKLWGREQTTIFGGDPGAPVGQVDNAVFARVGFAGLKGRAGQLTFGKQWAPYSDVAGMTDQAYVFGGDAAGVYAAGTDGGISGTGRADYATQYRYSNEHFSLGLQTQSRSRSENDQSWADTVQGAFTWHAGRGFHVGATYHEVRDGVVDPEPDEANKGDKATVVAISYDRPGHLYVGATYADLENHERDDTGVFFSGRGFEFFTRYYVTERSAIEGVFNDLEPDDSYDGQYRLRYFAATYSYRYAKSSVIYAGYKSEQSRAADGSDLQNDVFGLGFNYSF